MRKSLFALTITGLLAASAMAVPGESWILEINHRDDPSDSLWIEYPGAGYNGGSAWERDSFAGDWRRIYWELSGKGSFGNDPPDTAEQYRIEFFVPTAGSGDWQPIESQFYGAGGEPWPYWCYPDMGNGSGVCPSRSYELWAGAYGTNHQWIGSEFLGNPPGDWAPAGPGPQVPEDASFTAGPNGTRMWLKRGSWLYAKWDFGYETDRAWSALRLTQVTGCYIPPQDADGDGDVDLADFLIFQACFNGPNQPYAEGADAPKCGCLDADHDNDVDLADFLVFQGCFNGPNRPPACP
jgi:hypothetical protein